MKYSIIIPMYNAEESITQCIKSIKNQLYTNYECLLIDDGSSDKTYEICENLIKADSRFRLFININKGVSSARNMGISNATGDYLIFVDSDDYVEANLLSEIDKVADNQIIQYQFYSIKNNERKAVYNTKKEIDILAGNMAVVWRHALPYNLIKELRFNEELGGGEDYLYLNEALKIIGKIESLKVCLYNHIFDREKSIMNNINLKILYQQIIATENVKKLYCENEFKKIKKIFRIREKWCKGELLLYTFNLFNNSNKKIKQIWYRIIKKIIISVI